jgi:hypothetical protein
VVEHCFEETGTGKAVAKLLWGRQIREKMDS